MNIWDHAPFQVLSVGEIRKRWMPNMGKQVFFKHFKLRRWHKDNDNKLVPVLPSPHFSLCGSYNHVPKIYKSPFDCGLSFGNFLEKKGFKRLGSGTYSTVYGKDGSDKVLKVCHRLDAWMDYISWAAQKGYCGTYAPRVYSYKYFKGKTSPFYVAVVERLKEEVGCLDNTHPQAFTYNAIKFLSYPPAEAVNDNIKQCLEGLSPGINQFTTDFNAFSKNRAMDFHRGNFMVRKDGSFVATDPIMGHQKDPTMSRLRSNHFTNVRLAA